MHRFRDRIEEYIRREAKPIEKFGHQPRLYKLTVEIGKGHKYDDDVVHAAAWLHDIGVFVGHRPEEPKALAAWDNTAYAMRRVPDLLKEFGFPQSKTAAVLETIRTHQPAGQPTIIEGDILRDGDILEQLGAIGILRTVCKVGRDTRFHDFTSADVSLRKALDTLPKQLRLETARRLAEPRVRLLETFLHDLEAEGGGALY